MDYDNHIGKAIEQKIDIIAQNVLMEQENNRPEMLARFGSNGSRMYVNGIKFHIRYLSECIAISSPTLYNENVAWFNNFLAQFQISTEDVIFAFKSLCRQMQENLSQADGVIVSQYIENGIEKLSLGSIQTPSFVGGLDSSDQISSSYLEVLLKGEKQAAMKIITDWMKDGTEISEIYVEIFQKTQYEIGRLWGLGRINVAQEHYCTAASQSIMSQLFSQMWSRRKQNLPRYRAIVVCVERELHEFGARMLADLLELDGWDVLYLGANTPQASIVQITQDRKPRVLLLSASMVDHVHEVADIINGINEGVRQDGLKILVGGNPFNIDKELWKKVGADGYAPDARMAVLLSRQMADENDEQA
jgi:methanogenic corrinoid protein MtbC1